LSYAIVTKIEVTGAWSDLSDTIQFSFNW